MDNHKVFCGFIIFLQIADLSWESAYNFSLCNHDEIREDLLNVLDAHMTLKEELQLDFHTCEDAPEGPEQSEGWLRAQREGRLLQCVLDGARGCGHRGLWPSTLWVVQRNCRGYRPPQEWRRGTVAPQEAVPGGGLCDEGKVRELLAVWRSYMNLA
ncbi:uncharacterized protein LOC118156472 isoform X2 [Oxyura jamaicensis]|uniref:uncharacterized protein LOC118156472 isoform X2 n=1 Tax=Oxyura jamaicensis TaxID=8884 RepID=UPI0015A60B36|nr:uncharacterized protein LOC118156472 isoform X2 [Oxyura jamaicensis]